MINYCVLRKMDYEEDESFLLQRKLFHPIYCIACSLHIEGWPWRMSAAWWGRKEKQVVWLAGLMLAGMNICGKELQYIGQCQKWAMPCKVATISRMNDEYDVKFSKDLPYNTVHQLSLKSCKGKRTVWAFFFCFGLQTGALRSSTDVLYH